MPNSQVIESGPGYEPDTAEVVYKPAQAGSVLGMIRRRVALLVWFLAAFGVSYGVVVVCGSRLARQHTSLAVDVKEGDRDGLFPDALVVTSAGTALRVGHGPALNPGGSGDFLLYIWFKLRKPLTDGERAVFVAKYDPSSKTRPGYSLALVGEPDGVRPHVYWQNEQQQGRWYPFASTQVHAREWYLLALSFRDARYLGVHLMSHQGGKKPELLGGYDLEPSVVPNNQADLLVGGFGASKFRGRIGPFGIIRREDMTEDLASFVVQMAKAPGELPSEVEQSEIVLQATPKEDQGPLKQSIRPSTNDRAQQVQEREHSRE